MFMCLGEEWRDTQRNTNVFVLHIGLFFPFPEISSMNYS